MEYLVKINNLSENFEALFEKKNFVIDSRIIFNDSSPGQLKPNDILFFTESGKDQMIKVKAIISKLQEIQTSKNKIVFLKGLKKLKQLNIVNKTNQINPDELVVEKIEAIKII